MAEGKKMGGAFFSQGGFVMRIITKN